MLKRVVENVITNVKYSKEFNIGDITKLTIISTNPRFISYTFLFARIVCVVFTSADVIQ